MSPNIHEPESPTRKRSHRDFLDGSCSQSPGFADLEVKRPLHASNENIPIGKCFIRFPPIVKFSLYERAAPSPRDGRWLLTWSQEHTLSPLPSLLSTNSPVPQSSPGSLTDAGSSTPARHSPSPLTPTRNAMPATGATADQQPPAKRKKLTAAEKEEKAKADAAKKQEREEAKAAKAIQAAEREAEKQKRAEEREKQKRAKDEEKQKRDEEKKQKQREKEEQERKVLEAKEKKERSQLRLNSFFRTGPSTPKKGAGLALADRPLGTSPSGTPQKPAAPADIPHYDKVFQPFFVKENVTLARNAFGVDDETMEAKARAIDEYIKEEGRAFAPPRLNPTSAIEYFHLPSQRRAPRGRRYPNVRKIMSIMSDFNRGATSAASIDLTTESQNAQIKMTQNLLQEVPMKFLGFKEDVRPAYFGTVTNVPPSSSLGKLARNPTSRSVLPLNYDYDSEAEWVDDGDGEDVNEDMEDDEEEPDEDEEMADFLDDSEDAGINRHAFVGGMEPESTGLCWENRKRLGPLPHMYKFRQEFILGEFTKIRPFPLFFPFFFFAAPEAQYSNPSPLLFLSLDTLDHHSEIDPFSTKYWETEQPKAPKAAIGEQQQTSSAPGDTTGPKAMPPPPVPSDAFSVLTSSTANKGDAKKTMVPADVLPDFKRAILKYPKLSKLGLTEILSTEFTKCTKVQVRASIEAIAERTGTGQDKTWKLKVGFEL